MACGSPLRCTTAGREVAKSAGEPTRRKGKAATVHSRVDVRADRDDLHITTSQSQIPKRRKGRPVGAKDTCTTCKGPGHKANSRQCPVVGPALEAARQTANEQRAKQRQDEKARKAAELHEEKREAALKRKRELEEAAGHARDEQHAAKRHIPATAGSSADPPLTSASGSHAATASTTQAKAAGTTTLDQGTGVVCGMIQRTWQGSAVAHFIPVRGEHITCTVQ
jgi:hypothetical protein